MACPNTPEQEDEKVITTAMEMSPRRADTPSTTSDPDYCLVFRESNGHYHLLHEHEHGHRHQLRNSLLAAVGFFELANAGDFAANVWNQAPLPSYAIALMAIGGTFALCMPYFAYRDARLSWSNVQGLRCERRYLLQSLQTAQQQQQQQRESDKGHEPSRTIEALLNVNFREMGTEIIDRVGMDIFMGFGATMVGLGTLMAIDASNHSVWFASNLLSGYIGNAPLAIYGLLNLFWSVYVWQRARRHGVSHGAKLQQVPETHAEAADPIVGNILKARIAAVQLHAALNGITGVVAGAASLITSTMWWGYIVLIPCIVISIIVNYAFRHGLGYDRPLVIDKLPSLDEACLTEELRYVASIQRVLPPFSKKKPSSSLFGVVSEPLSLPSLLEFVTKNGLFEDFCLRLLRDEELSGTLLDMTTGTVTIQARTLSSVNDDTVRSRLVEMARECIYERGPIHFKYRERYLLETLGCYMMATAYSSTIESKTEYSASEPDMA